MFHSFLLTVSRNMQLRAPLASFLVYAFIGSAHAGGEKFQFPSPEHGSVCMETPNREFDRMSRCGAHTPSIHIDKKVSDLLKGAELLIPVLATGEVRKTRLVFLARAPSNSAHPTGFCGAGYEDSLLLLQEHNGNLKIRDRFLIQSCLKSLVLEPDQEDDPRNSFVLSVAPPGISFRWSGDDALTTRIISVENSSLKMIVDQRNSTQQPTRTRIE